jgi:MscS family membrane protein
VFASPPAQALEGYVSPLAPPDTSSPRATLKSFRDNMELAYRDFYEGRYGKTLPYATAGQERAVGCLDSSQLPPIRAHRTAAEAALLINDVLDRLSLPAYDEIPDAQAMAELPPDVPRVWRIPGTEIEIARVTEGPRAGEYLFSPDTVDRAYEIYELAGNIAYRPNTMAGLYDRIRYASGRWIPMRWIEALPEAAKRSVLGQSLWKWVAMVLVACVWILIVYLAHRISRPKGQQPRYWLRFFLALLLLPLTVAFRDFYERGLIVVGPAFVVLDTVTVMLFYVIGAVAIINLGAAIATSIVASSRFEKQSLDANFVSVSCRAIAWMVALILLAYGASQLGAPLLAVITSLGVGGVAFALAARPTLENLIAGVTLYLDRPVKIGEFCQFDDVLGTVERIGLRSTRIRRWGGNLLSIPNAKFAEYQLDNYSDARYLWIRQRLRLRYETTPEQLSYILAKIREMLFAHPKILVPRVRLIGFGDDALTVEVLCYTDTGVWAQWHAIREDVLLRIMEIIEAAGTRLAVESKTVYVARDDGIDDEKKRAAEEQVHDWKERGELPFPDMSEEQLEALSGSVQFPPEGSVLNQPESEKD